MKTMPKVLMGAKDFSGRYILINNALLNMLGYIKQEQILGRDQYDVAHELNADALGGPDALAEEFLKEDEMAFRENELTAIYVHRTRGILRFFMSNKGPYRDEKQKIIGAIYAGYEIVNPSINLLRHYLTLEEENFILSEESRKNIHWYIEEFHQSIILNKRELECVNLLAKGLTAKESANQLELSHRTVEFYLDNAKNKLKCVNAQELLAKCLSLGWLDISI